MPPSRGTGQSRPSSHGYNPYTSHTQHAQPHHNHPFPHHQPAPLDTTYGAYGAVGLPSEPSSATSLHFTFPPSDEETKPILPVHGHYQQHPQQPATSSHQHMQSDYGESSMAVPGGLVDGLVLTSPGEPSGSRNRSSSRKHLLNARQQFTACGACRLRRVKCDLKDVAMSRPPDSAEPLQCTNCKQRHLHCVDEYAKKPAKMMRRGRRLQQAQAMYGIGSSSQSSSPTMASFAPRRSTMPLLNPSFFQSEFFKHFYFQRPIVDASEFTSFCEPGGMGLLGEVGDLVAKCLVIWAASYGVDPSGRVFSPNRQDLRQRMDRCKPMVQEVLEEVDRRGVLRKLSWDNVRLMCLLLPLTIDTLSPPARNAMYRSVLSHAYELSRPNVEPVRVGAAMEVADFLKLRILWYVLVFEGVKTALYGNPLLLDEEVWKGCLPLPRSSPFESGPSGIDSRPSTAEVRGRSGGRNSGPSGTSSSLTRTAYVPADDLAAMWAYALPPVDASFACRRIHAQLTSSQAQSRPALDAKGVEKIWEMLDRCWQEFEELKSSGPLGTGSINTLPEEERAMLASRWQIFLVECHVVVLDALKARLVRLSEAKPDAAMSPDSPPSPSGHSSHAEFTNVQQLVDVAKSHCARVAERAISMFPWLLNTNLFQHDSTLLCRGVFLAGRFLVEEHRATEDDVRLCLQALDRMHWAFGNSMELEQQLRNMVSNDHQSRQRMSQQTPLVSPVQGPLGPWNDYSPELPQPSFPSGYGVAADDYQFTGSLPGTSLSSSYGPFNQLPELASTAADSVHLYPAPHDPSHTTGGAIYAQEHMAGSDAAYGEQVHTGPNSGQPTPDSAGENIQRTPFAFVSTGGGGGPGPSSTSPSTVYNSRPTSSHQAFHVYTPSQVDSFALHTPTGPAFPPFASPNSIGQGSTMHFVAQEIAHGAADTYQNPVSLEFPSPTKSNPIDITQQQYQYIQSPYNNPSYQAY